MITGNENLKQIAESYPNLIPVFEKHGLGSFFKKENLSKIGRFTILNTLLKSKNIDATSFINNLNTQQNKPEQSSDSTTEDLHFAAMLPCGLRNPFKEFSEAYLQDNADLFKDLNYLIEGNVNHELSYYPLLDSIKDENELPDIIVASDVNNFFHKPFLERFIETGLFECYAPYAPNNYLEKVGYADPDKHFTMFTSNLLVMAVDVQKLGDRKMPETWHDLLAPEFENSIIMRGEDDFFCNAVMLPFFKDNGFEAIHKLARNIKSGKHPAEMVKLAGSNNEEGAAVYILPYFFSKRIKNKNVEVVWPKDGAIASPVFLLAKKSRIDKHKELLDFLLSKETGQMLVGRYFPSIHPDVENNFNEAVKWLGWDFLKGYDIAKLKEEIRTEFMTVWEPKSIEA